jgi:hypothetical protein
MTVTIEGVDRTRLIDLNSLRIINVLTNQPDTCQFIVKKFGTRTFAPTPADEVIITDGSGTKIFAGHIQEVREEYDKLDYVGFSVTCTDYTRSMDQRLIVDSYEDQTVDQIIAHFKANYFPNAITINNVNCPTTIDRIQFNYEYPSDALRQLAEITNSDWYIDYDRDLHFFAKNTVLSPFDLTDTNGKYIYDSLNIRKDLSQLRNTIFVRGGEYLADTITAIFDGNAATKHFLLPYKMANVTLTVTGDSRSLGVDPLDDPTGYDALHNFQEKLIKFRDDKIPRDTSALAASQKIRVGGNPYLPVIIKKKDQSSIDTFTGREYLIIDKSIKTKEAARQRADAELLAYKSTINEGSFDTYESGLRSGQRINVQSTLRGVSADYMINKVETRVFAVDTAAGDMQFIYKVSLMTTRTYDYIRLLQDLMNAKKKEIVISDDEVLDEVEGVEEILNMTELYSFALVHNPLSDSLSLTEVWTAQQLNYDVDFVVGLWTSSFEENNKRQFILDGSPLE